MYWSADSAPIGDTEGRGRVDVVGDRCSPEYCRDRQLITDDPDLRLSISFYISSLDHSQSQKAYSSSRAHIQEHFPECKILSYAQVKRRVSDLSGVVTWKRDMCVDSCVGFTGPFKDMEKCPCCDKSRWDEDGLRKSNGKKKVPRKVFTMFPLGPQLQSRWRSPEMARKMFYWRDKTQEEQARYEDEDYVYDDIFCGSDYLEAVENGVINDYDKVVMLSINGAQLYRNKKSDCWIYIWILLDLAPDQRYEICNILPGGVRLSSGQCPSSRSSQWCRLVNGLKDALPVFFSRKIFIGSSQYRHYFRVK